MYRKLNTASSIRTSKIFHQANSHLMNLNSHQEENSSFEEKLFANKQQVTKAFYEQNLGLIPYGCHRYGLSKEETYDAYVDSIMIALDQVQHGKFRGECAIETYLFQIFRFRCLRAVKRAVSTSVKGETIHLTDPVSTDPDPQSQLEMSETLDHLKRQCNRLNKHFWQILEDLILKGYNLEEIAERVGLKSGACVASVKWRYLKQLRASA